MRISDWSSDVCSSDLLAERGAGGDLEGQHAGVDVMAGAIDQRRLEVDQREARQHAGLQRRLEALLDAGNEFARHRTAGDGVLEGEAGTRLLRLKHKLDAGELTGAARLLLVGDRKS